MKATEGRCWLVAIGTCLIALSATFTSAAAQEPAAQVDSPALWKIPGPTGNVFLFGSLHLLPDGVKWRTTAVDSALNEAKVVVFETDFTAVQDQQVLQPLIAKYGLLPRGQTLGSILPENTYADFEKTAMRLGLPPTNLAPLRPWLATLTLSVQFIIRQGLDPNNGVDQQVMTWAKANGKALGALETNESQFTLFADLSREQEIELLAVTLQQIHELPQMLDDILAAYRKGDLPALEKALNSGFDDFPTLRRRLFKDRHDKWVPQIEQMIRDGRSHVIVVGVGHLVGTDSVIAMLRSKGVKIEGP